ncbi:glycoprotein 3-alpha-L-fucosyltransferase A-like [Ylistrum balloti]|uniref:glycoprotein 3-alpha-L-fucosyltransferase A-like n=1 Tax=Ylistrum balloti TaxID=509963 RepID=UPI002905C40D|nr:glycoprotein 3-alpha-L-fucosyltransferase A-like [Ylistrum balloti]
MRENELKNSIKDLENEDILNINEIEVKKRELENIRKLRMKGSVVRSRAQWIEEGEKPTSYFFGLENRNFTSKIIPKIQIDEGAIVTKQDEILGLFSRLQKQTQIRQKWSGEKQTNPFHQCEYRCHLIDGISNKRDAVIVFQAPSLFDEKPLKKYSGQLWVFFSMEAPTYHPPSNKIKKWENLFNWTMGYRRDSDIVHFYGRFHRLPKTGEEINITSTWYSQLNKSILFVSHCGTASRRLDYINTMKSFYDIDIYGACGKLKCPKSKWGECHKKIENYKFYLAFENSLCKDYITEKMFKIYWLNSKAIPVGRGPTQYDVYLPPNTYLDTSKYRSSKELADHMWRLSKNESEATTYFKWKKSFYVDNNFNSRGFCELCRRLHHPTELKKYTRLYTNIDIWLRGGKDTNICRPPTDL